MSAGFEALVGATGSGDLSKLIALRALVDRANGDGTVERANWLTGVREEYQRWYARHGVGEHPENFPASETLRYLDEHIVRTLAAEGVLEAVVRPDPDGAQAAGDVPWAAVRLTPWAATDVDERRGEVLHLLDGRIRAILEQDGRAPAAPAPSAEPGVDLPPAPEMDGPAVHETAAEPVSRPGEMLVPGGATLSARGLVKVYRKRRVVNEVDVHVSQGEIVGLLGPNGAGKTTSFYMMVGLIRPDKGKVFIGERNLTGVPMYRRARAGIGYLAQEPSIFRKLSVEENVMAILQMMKIPRAQRKQRLETLLDELSIKHLRKTRAYALSGGERRRLEITRALVGNPKFMLLDEPFAGVDPIAVHDIQQIVSDLRRRGIGVLISDHNVEQTLDIVDRAYIMYDGRVRVSGTVSELVWNEEVAEIYLGPTLTARMRERYPDPALQSTDNGAYARSGEAGDAAFDGERDEAPLDGDDGGFDRDEDDGGFDGLGGTDATTFGGFDGGGYVEQAPRSGGDGAGGYDVAPAAFDAADRGPVEETPRAEDGFVYEAPASAMDADATLPSDGFGGFGAEEGARPADADEAPRAEERFGGFAAEDGVPAPRVDADETHPPASGAAWRVEPVSETDGDAGEAGRFTAARGTEPGGDEDDDDERDGAGHRPEASQG
jgi:lipopolysaccharide export system ATP-binding protein